MRKKQKPKRITHAPLLRRALAHLVYQIQRKGIADQFKFDLVEKALDKSIGL